LLLAPPDGAERAQLLQFVGRFHPLSVHLPIAVLFLVPLFELSGKAAIFPICFQQWTSFFASRFARPFLRHTAWMVPGKKCRLFGPIDDATYVGCNFLSPPPRGFVGFFARESTPHVLPGLTASRSLPTLGLVAFTGYRGGQLSQGENHLTQFMPGPMRSLLGISTSENGTPKSSGPDPTTFYGARIQPLFTAHSVTCHGQNKPKAGLRLDSFAAVIRGSKHGPVVRVGDTKNSELFRRITLPPMDEDFMPAEHKRPLSPDDVKLIELWISSGASATQSADAPRRLRRYQPVNPPSRRSSLRKLILHPWQETGARWGRSFRRSKTSPECR
jgi:hypothetical protein